MNFITRSLTALCVIAFVGHYANASTYTIELPWDQTASLGSTSCCNYGSLGSFNGTFTRTGNCQTVYGSCVQSRRTAFWTFDLTGLPEGATVISASFKGSTEYNDQGGSATFGLKAVAESLTTSLAMSIINAPDWQSSQYIQGGSFSIGLSANAVEAARSQGKIAFREYVSTTNTVSVYNTGTNAARLSLTIEVPNVWGACCLDQDGCVNVPQYNCEMGGFTFLGEGVECTPSSCGMCIGDFDANGLVDVEDLLSLIAVYGTSDTDHDLNGDELISIEDLLILLDHYGQC
jgi:hypothetical protein